MIIREIKAVEQAVIIDVICNQCGESCAKKHDGIDIPDIYGAEVEYSTGYYSTALPDGKMYRFHLCEGCLKNLMAGFKVPADEHDFF